MRGYFITFEGTEGAGKSTNLHWAAEWLSAHAIDVVTTREPGGTVIAEQIRALLLNPDLPDMHPDTELMLMFAARNEHLQTKILPALQQGKWVLCDRFTDASYAYQGFGRGLSLERIALLETWIQGTLRPDATILFDLPVTLGMQRASARAGQSDRIEREQMAFFERIRTGYLQRAKTFPAQYHLVDATQTLPAVREQLAQNLALFLTKSGVMP